MYENQTMHLERVPAKPHRGFAITAMTLGIIGALFGLIPLTCWIAIICGVLALVFGLIARRHGMGKAGIILGTIALALGIWGAVIVNSAVNQLNDDLSDYSATG